MRLDARRAEVRTRGRSSSRSPWFGSAASAHSRTTCCLTPTCCSTRCAGRRANRGHSGATGRKGDRETDPQGGATWATSRTLGKGKPRQDLCLLPPQAEVLFHVLFWFFFFLSSWSYRNFKYVNFLTPGVSSALDFNVWRSGTWASVASSLRPPGSL